MEPFEITIALILIIGFSVLVFLNLRKGGEGAPQKETLEESAKVKAESEQKEREIGRIMEELKSEQKDKNELQGKNKQMYVENESLKAEVKRLQQNCEATQKIISKFEAEEVRKMKEHEKQIESLENSRKKLEEEQARVIRDDEEKSRREKEEYDRMWKEHENKTCARLKEISQKRDYSFLSYDNANLPDGFDGSLKPDFLIEFLGQYIIFDAKESNDLPTYLNDQVKKTAMKIKKSSSFNEIYPVVFFVVPHTELGNLRKAQYYEEGITFFVVSPETIEPILAAYKKITEYENLADLDPQERENIVNLIAQYDRHISFQNAANILISQEGVKVMREKKSLPMELMEEVELKKKNMRPVKLKDSELKKLTESPEEQEKAIEDMVKPKRAIEKKDLEETQESLL